MNTIRAKTIFYIFAAAISLIMVSCCSVASAAALPNDPGFSNQWYLLNTGQNYGSYVGTPGDDIGVTQAWEATEGVPTVTVAVIDTGIELDHPDLSGSIWHNPGESGEGKEDNGIDDDNDGYIDDYQGYDFANFDNVPEDVSVSGHGTAMSGIIAATNNNEIGISGIAPKVKLMVLKVGNTESSLTNSAIASAIAYASKHGARIINMSLEGGYSSEVENAISFSSALVIVAAGNDGRDDDSVTHSSSYGYPCALPEANVLCVAGTNPDDSLAGFSNYGANSVDLGAPGQKIYTTIHNGSYGFVEGTSPAAAVTSGAAALLASYYPSMRSSELKAKLMSTVDPDPALEGKTVSGGRLDIGNALDFNPPVTSFTFSPGHLTNNTEPAFQFKADERATFECSLDGATYSSCETGPYTGAYYANGLPEGDHVFDVVATDKAGNVADPTEYDFTVDTTAPQTIASSGPSGIVKSNTASFTYSSDDDTASFQCNTDSSGWQPCGDGSEALTGLSEGGHTFEVRAIDPAGNIDRTPISYNWITDAQNPETTITSTPPASGNSATASFSFSGSEPGSFECKLDAGGWQSCASPQTYTGVTDGQHTFSVRETDTAGNVEALPPSYQWTVDRTPPETTITSGPPATSENTSPSFTYASSETGASFECRLDGGAYSSCSATGTISYSGLSVGSHVFFVRATDPIGNTDPTPAEYRFDIIAHTEQQPPGGGTQLPESGSPPQPGPGGNPPQSPPPGGNQPPAARPPHTKLRKHPPKHTRSHREVFKLAGGKRYRYRLDTGKWHFTNKARVVLKAKTGKHVFQVEAISAAGIRDPKGVSFKFIVQR